MSGQAARDGTDPATAANPWLVAGGILSAAAALLHLGVIAGGADWYRFFGAGEAMARLAERGDWRADAITLVIATMLVLAAVYAFAGAGLIPRQPLLRTMLVTISAAYLLRGMLLFYPPAFGRPDLSPAFMFWSSLVVLVFGLVHAIGTWKAWPHLKKRKEPHALGP